MPISQTSRNTLAPIIEVQDDNGNVIVPARVDIRESIDESRLSDIRQFTYVAGNTWGNLGQQQLGDARNWWAIAELSGVLNPFTELTPGRALRTISVESLYLDVLTGV